MKRLIRVLVLGSAALLIVALLFREKLDYMLQQASPVEYSLDLDGIAAPSTRVDDDSLWLTLFDGNTLEGWDVKFTGHPLGENLHNTFRVDNGLLSVDYSDWEDFSGEFGHLFTRADYAHYILQLEYRFIGEQLDPKPWTEWAWRNNGVMLHAQAPQTMTLHQEFPVSIEAQLLGGRAEGERSTGNVCTPGTNILIDNTVYRAHCTESVSPTLRGDQWVQFEIEVRGDQRIRHFVNGELVFEYGGVQYDPMADDAKPLLEQHGLQLRHGHIALQAETHPTQFRNIRLYPLAANDPL